MVNEETATTCQLAGNFVEALSHRYLRNEKVEDYRSLQALAKWLIDEQEVPEDIKEGIKLLAKHAFYA